MMRRALLLLLLLAAPAWAADPGIPFMSATQAGGGTAYSLPIQTLLFLTALSFLPAILLMMTAFTRIVIVLSLLKQALGTTTVPPSQVIVGLSLFLTFFVMSPVLNQVNDVAVKPLMDNQISMQKALQSGAAPLRTWAAASSGKMTS